MDINIRNIIGAIGLVLLIFYSRPIVRGAREMNPLSLIDGIQVSSEPGRLLILGALVVGLLSLLRYATRR